MLRKDSERRATLHHILTEDGDKVVGNLLEALAQVSGVEGRERTRHREEGWIDADTSTAVSHINTRVEYLYMYNLCN